MSRPLWEVMHQAYDESAVLGRSWENGDGYAAELRALAEIIEQRGAQGLDRDPGETADWLRAEAERAEGQA
jgi:hypothetical protein